MTVRTVAGRGSRLPGRPVDVTLIADLPGRAGELTPPAADPDVRGSVFDAVAVGIRAGGLCPPRALWIGDDGSAHLDLVDGDTASTHAWAAYLVLGRPRLGHPIPDDTRRVGWRCLKAAGYLMGGGGGPRVRVTCRVDMDSVAGAAYAGAVVTIPAGDWYAAACRELALAGGGA